MKAPLSLLIALTAGMVKAQIVCIQVTTTTINYETAVKPHGTECPVNQAKGISYYSANAAGCCTSTATPKTLGTQGAACCPCGALCTGYFPSIMAWNLDSNGQLLLTPTDGPGPVETIIGTTPFHGPTTANSTTDSVGNPTSTSTSQQSLTTTSQQSSTTGSQQSGTATSQKSTSATSGQSATSSSLRNSLTAPPSVTTTASSSGAEAAHFFSLRKGCSLTFAALFLIFVYMA